MRCRANGPMTSAFHEDRSYHGGWATTTTIHDHTYMHVMYSLSEGRLSADDAHLRGSKPDEFSAVNGRSFARLGHCWNHTSVRAHIG
jgi:hypothetical protein